MTAVDWNEVEPVDIIAGGFPCQDVSSAGKRAGMVDGTRSNLWGAMRTAVETIRPRYVIAENVRGLLSAKAQSNSELELNQGFMGDESAVNLRALGRVLGDLADLGYDAQWYGLRAADIGAPHHRSRVFIFAWDRQQTLSHTKHDGHATGPNRASNGTTTTPRARPGSVTPVDNGQPSRRRTADREPEHLYGTATTANTSNRRQLSRPVGNLPGNHSPTSTWLHHARRARRIEHPNTETAWGDYEPAIRRWEQFTGRPAPAATEPTGRDEQHQLSARFTEWIMGLPDGWVTNVEGVSRAQQIKMLGNGVVPQQALAALQHMTAQLEGQHENAIA